ncbi:energy transducer TonB [Limibacter armeniacum]|uniref:energy transducer TonB n=1 Tax=Limibacter armeniacum TaxID=466084 RepID=UPI002FE55A3F
MEKNPLHKWRPFFITVGLSVSLSLTLMAFEWKTYNDETLISLGKLQLDEEKPELPPITKMKPPQPPKVITAPKIVEVDDTELIKDIKVDFIEFDPDMDIEEIEETTQIEEVIGDEPFDIVEENALPEGGMGTFLKWVAGNIRYPSQAKRMQVEGTVYVQFIVNKDGNLTDFQVMRGIGGGCDEEAVRVLKKATSWKPAKQRGRPVRQRMVLPVKFRLQ